MRNAEAVATAFDAWAISRRRRDARHHVEQMHANERHARRETDRSDLVWRQSRIEGHAVRAAVAMLGAFA